MIINIVAYGIAKDILGDRKISLELAEGETIGSLKEKLTNRYPKFQALASLQFAINEEYKNDSVVIEDGNVVVIIPPVSGG